MRLPLRESWRLRAIERELRRSEPHLAGMLAVFAGIHAGEAIADNDQLNWRVTEAAAVPGRLAGLRAGARRRLGRIARALFVMPGEAVGPTQSMRSPGQ
jgi:hypothetical protein